jgi:putative FmdB family regulatory protein
MPIYEYECRSCGHRFERLLRPPAPLDGIHRCPSCTDENVERLLSPFAVSSAQTRHTSLQRARKLAEKEQREKKAAQAIHDH